VGWYSSVFLGAYFTKAIVEAQADYQSTIPGAILLAFDPAPTAQGMLSLKALRLTDVFMHEWRNQTRLGSEAFTRLVPSSIFETLPIKVRNSHLTHLFMSDLIDNKSLQSPLTLRPAAMSTSGSAEKQHGSSSSAISSAVGHAVGTTTTSVAAAELETDFARLDLATGALATAHCPVHVKSTVPLTSAPPPPLPPKRPPSPPLLSPPSTAPFLEKHLDEIGKLTDSFLEMQASQRRIASEIQANVAQQQAWLQNRRAENERLQKEGHELKPEFDASLPFFNAVTDRNGRDALDMSLISAQVTAYCQSVSRFTDTTFGKLFLAASIQKNNL
jgi:hypothetical protein